VVSNGRSRVLDAIGSDRVVDAIAAASSIPLGGLVPSITMVTQDGSAISAAYNYVSPRYFDLLSIPILRGRHFSSQETVYEEPVAIVSAAGDDRRCGRSAARVLR